MTNAEPGITSLAARVHVFVRPERREAFIELFRDVLGCKVIERDVGLEHPILFVPFPDGSGFSVEFTGLAPSIGPDDAADDEHAFRGAWMEFRTPRLDRAQAALRNAGVPEFRHTGSSDVYFVAPGGQVFRLVDIDATRP